MMDEAVTNMRNHEEGIYMHSPSKNENWTEVTPHLQKRDPSSPVNPH
jgi:hypothetical protein